MYAASRASNEAVAFLLSRGASPDLMDYTKGTALQVAMNTNCSSTIDLLAPVTTKGLKEALIFVAGYHNDLTPAVEDLLRRAALDKNAKMLGVECACQYGNARVLKILTQGWDKNTMDPTEANNLLGNALMSDNADTVEIVRAFVPSVSSENIVLAMTRGRSDVVKLFGLGEDEESIEAAKKRLKAEIVNKTASIAVRLHKIRGVCL